MQITLKENERIDDLQRNGYRIIQNPDKFCFGMDAVLLSAWAKAEPGMKILDMGTGTGVIPILMEARCENEIRNNDKEKCHFTGLEIQPDMAEMADRSVKLNDISGSVKIVCGDIKKASEIFGAASFDVITCNPPYMNENHGLKNPDDSKAIARHELLCTLEDVIREASKCLVSGGKFYMVHRPHRLTEIIETMKKYHIEPKRMRMVHPHIGDEAKMVLIEGIRSGGSFLKVEAPLVIYDENGKYTEEVYSIYEN